MKKKFTKERFYKRMAYQHIASIEDAFQKAHTTIKDVKKINDAIKIMRQKQYELQQAELENGTACIITGERTKTTPEFEKSLKEFLGRNPSITVNQL